MRVFTYIVIFYCLFSFKFNLIPYADTGIRFDDFLIALFAFLVVLNKDLFLNKPIILMYMFVVWSLISTIINTSLTGISALQGVFFSIRNVEYLLFFYVGVYYRYFLLRLHPLFAGYLIYSAIVVGAIYFGVISGTSDFHPSRAFANTNGPYEYVILVTFLAIYFVQHRSLILSGFAFCLMMLTSSRITIAAFLLVQFFAISTRAKLLLMIPMVLIIYLVLLFSDSLGFYFVDRFTGLFNDDLINSLESLFANKEIVRSQSEYLDNVYNDVINSKIASMGGDTSALIRFNKWIVLILSTINLNPISLFIGLGPSFASVGVDGNYVRIFVETGLIGLVIYLLFLGSLLNYAKRHNEVVLRRFVLVLMISAIFIDVLVSYKVMLLLWFYFGYVYQKNREVVE